MICPYCEDDHCRRSHRRGKREYALGLLGLRPWRCRECNQRFLGWRVPLRNARYAHCGSCGNLHLQRISSQHTDGEFAFLWRAMKIPSYRCPICRKHFFSLLKRKFSYNSRERNPSAAPDSPEQQQTQDEAF